MIDFYKKQGNIDMNRATTENKQGQALGEKGKATRRRLMDAARRLLKSASPMELTAVSIAQQANTSSSSFYMYFNDVKDIMYSLSEAAGEDMADVHAVLDEPWVFSTVEVAHARRLVEAFDAVWNRHREVLRYRNLEADRGDPRFEELKVNSYLPVIERMAAHILAGYPPGKRPPKGDAYAEASVLYSMLEGLASMDPKVMERGLGIKRMQNARARIIAHVLGGRADINTWHSNGNDSQEAKAPKARAAAKQRKAAK